MGRKTVITTDNGFVEEERPPYARCGIRNCPWNDNGMCVDDSPGEHCE